MNRIQIVFLENEIERIVEITPEYTRAGKFERVTQEVMNDALEWASSGPHRSVRILYSGG